MTRFGYHASHEQYPPSLLLEYAQRAERAGFDGVLSADHFHPWLEENGHSGYAWSWLGAALQATSTSSFGVVCAPGDRYHPAIVAQSAATLAEMYPGRFRLYLGSGEALNEHVTGNHWPTKFERNERLRECADVIRALWAGDSVTHRGHIVVVDARLYSRPSEPPPLFVAAVSEKTAEWAGGWADGLITTGRDRDGMEQMLDAFRRGGGEGKPVHVQHVLSWAPDENEARRVAHEQWRFAAIDDPEELWNLRTPRDFARATRDVTVEEVVKKVPTSSDLKFHAERLRVYAELGIERVFVLNVGSNQREFISRFGEEVIPALNSVSAA